MRKSGYLFAIWGEGKEDEIMQSARHKSLKNMKYKSDASFTLNLAKNNLEHLANITPKWKSIFCANVQLARSVSNVRGFVLANYVKAPDPDKTDMQLAEELLQNSDYNRSNEIDELLKVFEGLDSLSASKLRVLIARLNSANMAVEAVNELKSCEVVMTRSPDVAVEVVTTEPNFTHSKFSSKCGRKHGTNCQASSD
jgi:hypothetical protein